MNSTNVFILIVTIAIVLVSISLNYFYVKGQITFNKKRWSYYFIAIGVLFLIYYLGTRWVPLLEMFSKGEIPSKKTDATQYNLSYSWTWFLSFCTMFGLIIPILITFKKGRKFLEVISPLCTFAGGMVMFGSIIFAKEASWSLSYFFFDNIPEYPVPTVSMQLHLFILTIAFNFLIYQKRYKFKSFMGMLGYVLCYLSYVAIIMSIFHLDAYVSGLSLNDYFISSDNLFPNYGTIGKLLNSLPHAAVPFVAGIFYFFAILFLLFIKNLTVPNEKYEQIVSWYNYK